MILVAVSTGHFDPLIAECARLYPRYDFVGQIGSSTVTPPFPYVRTAPPGEIEALMKRAELVVSHGGAGMTAMLYRLRKKAVIIPKQQRYGEANDLQVELARKWGELDAAVICMDVEKLASAIEECRARNFEYGQVPALGAHVRTLLQLGEVGSGDPLEISGY